MTARIAMASGLVGLVATGFLAGFFAFEAPRVFGALGSRK